MIEKPELFVLDDAAIASQSWRRDHSIERYEFEPGFVALGLLCGVVSWQLHKGEWKPPGVEPLEYLDGPPDPRIDDGFQFHRIPRATARRLATLNVLSATEVVQAWRREFERYAAAIYVSLNLRDALGDLMQMADVADASGESIVAQVLFR